MGHDTHAELHVVPFHPVFLVLREYCDGAGHLRRFWARCMWIPVLSITPISDLNWRHRREMHLFIELRVLVDRGNSCGKLRIAAGMIIVGQEFIVGCMSAHFLAAPF
jgi:hypothetical protein